MSRSREPLGCLILGALACVTFLGMLGYLLFESLGVMP